MFKPLFVNEVSYGLVKERLEKAVVKALGVPGQWTQEEMDKVLNKMYELEARIELCTTAGLYELTGRRPASVPSEDVQRW